MDRVAQEYRRKSQRGRGSEGGRKERKGKGGLRESKVDIKVQGRMEGSIEGYRKEKGGSLEGRREGRKE